MNRPDRGDSHRFGKRVTAVQRASGNSPTKSYFHKPRPVHLEQLFLSPASPIAPFLNRLFPSRKCFEIECLETWNGLTESQDLVGIGPKPFNTESLAYWSYLALMFGLTDLHPENVGYIDVGSELHYSVFDIELIFVATPSLTYTNLIPTARPSDIDSKYSFPEFSLTDLVSNVLEIHSRAQTDLNDVIGMTWKTVQDVPIRLLLRPTSVYRQFLGAPNWHKNSFLPEELLQLRANDIPYFYRFLENEKVYFFDRGGSVASDQISHLEPKQPPQDKQTQDNQLVVAVLQLCQHFWKPNTEKIHGPHFSIDRSTELVKFKILDKSGTTRFLR